MSQMKTCQQIPEGSISETIKKRKRGSIQERIYVIT